MNKKQKNIKTKKSLILTGNKEIDKLIKIYILLIVIFFLFWGITHFLVNNKKTDTNEVPNTTIQYTNIMVGTMLSQNEESYYVLAETENDSWSETYKTYLSSYQSKEESLKYYIIELDNSFNKGYLADESNFSTEKLSDIKFKKTTLLKIENKKIKEVYENNGEILEVLKKIVK